MLDFSTPALITKRVTPSDVHVDRPLTNMSVAYIQSQDSFVADRIFPRINVQNQSDQYWIHDRSFWNRSEVRPRAPSSETLGGEMRFSTQPYFCEVFGVHMNVDDRTLANADTPLAPRQEAADWVTFQGLLFREKMWVSKYFGPGVWPNQEVGGPTASAGVFVYWNSATADPVGNVKRWKSTIRLASGGFAPNVMVIARRVYDALTECPAVIDRIKYGQTPGAPAIVTKQNLAALFELDSIEVLDAVENTGREGQAETNAYIAGNHVALFYRPPSAGLRTPSAGYTFVWSGYLGANNGQRITSFRMEPIRSERIELELTFDQRIIGTDLAFFGATAIV
jgi:hypothetical protein